MYHGQISHSSMIARGSMELAGRTPISRMAFISEEPQDVCAAHVVDQYEEINRQVYDPRPNQTSQPVRPTYQELGRGTLVNKHQHACV